MGNGAGRTISRGLVGGLGGALAVRRGATAVIEGVTFEDNFARFGGGIAAQGDVDVRGCGFAENEAEWGAGINCMGARCTIDGSVFIGGSAAVGGGISAGIGSDVAISRSAFCDNRALEVEIVGGLLPLGPDGSAFFHAGGLTQIHNSLFARNRVERPIPLYDPGTVAAFGPSEIVNNTFASNTAPDAAGGLWIDGVGGSTVTNNLFAGQRARVALDHMGLQGSTSSHNLFFDNEDEDAVPGRLAEAVQGDPGLSGPGGVCGSWGIDPGRCGLGGWGSGDLQPRRVPIPHRRDGWARGPRRWGWRRLGERVGLRRRRSRGRFCPYARTRGTVRGDPRRCGRCGRCGRRGRRGRCGCHGVSAAGWAVRVRWCDGIEARWGAADRALGGGDRLDVASSRAAGLIERYLGAGCRGSC